MYKMLPFRFYSLAAIVLLLLIAFAPVDAMAQCSMCRAVVEENISGKGTGINNGIVYLMIFPYALVVLLAVGMVMKMRKDRATE
jgi:Na+/H+ antiporter NhaC